MNKCFNFDKGCHNTAVTEYCPECLSNGGIFRDKQPAGIAPQWLHDEQRYSDLAGAIKRYLDGGYPIDHLWIQEYNELHEKIDKRNCN